jgi:hypothetical protein
MYEESERAGGGGSADTRPQHHHCAWCALPLSCAIATRCSLPKVSPVEGSKEIRVGHAAWRLRPWLLRSPLCLTNTMIREEFFMLKSPSTSEDNLLGISSTFGKGKAGLKTQNKHGRTHSLLLAFCVRIRPL